MIMHSFLETYSFSGKTVIPFCTYYTAEYETLNDIVRATSNSNHLEGLGIRGASSYDSNTIGTWLRSIGLDSKTTAIDNIEAADKQLQGRTLIPFGTHEMSGIGGLVRAIQTDLGISGITYLQELGLIGRTIGTADSQQQVETWLAQLGFSENR